MRGAFLILGSSTNGRRITGYALRRDDYMAWPRRAHRQRPRLPGCRRIGASAQFFAVSGVSQNPECHTNAKIRADREGRDRPHELEVDKDVKDVRPRDRISPHLLLLQIGGSAL